MVKAVNRAHEIGASAIQVFVDNPTAWRRRLLPPAELPAFRTRLDEYDITPVAVHASYLVNLAGSDPAYHARSVALLAAELRSARRFGAALVNVHIGSHGGAGIDAGVERLVTTIRLALEAEHEPDEHDTDGESATDEEVARLRPIDGGVDPLITLENSVGAGFGLGVDVDELTTIADALGAAGIPDRRIAFCLDTAHAWGAGANLAEPEGVDAYLAKFDRLIGLDRLLMVHLNDSRSARGERTDRHEHVGGGEIGERGLGQVVRHPALRNVPLILETPGMDEGYDAINLARVRALVAGETLEPLPAAAFEVSSGGHRSAAPD